MQNTRQQILTYLKKHQTASAKEISRALHMTAANARHHIGLLRAQNLIAVVGTRPAKTRGRPTKLYALAHQAMEANIERLVDALLKLLLQQAAAQPFEELIPLLFGEPPETNNELQRLNQVVQRLNALKYRARWEASPGGPRVIFRHCPYASILEENPELCQMDAAALAKLLDMPVKQIARLEYDGQGAPSCVFAVQAR